MSQLHSNVLMHLDVAFLQMNRINLHSDVLVGLSDHFKHFSCEDEICFLTVSNIKSKQQEWKNQGFEI